MSTVAAGADSRGLGGSEDPTKAPGSGEEVPDPTLRATIMYLLLKIVSVLNVKDGKSKSMCIAQVTDITYQ